MEAPDKIYLNILIDNPKLDNTTWDTKEFEDCINVEYIQKDIIIEWVNALGKCSPSISLLTHELIDKINKL